ncbi:MAG: DUF1292 domain-containing protein [Bacilli bacterium]
MVVPNEDQIVIFDEDGNEELYNVYHSFYSEEHGKAYVVVYPASADENGEEEIELSAFAFVANEDDDNGQLLPIETDEEWEMVEGVIEALEDIEE